MAANKSEKMLNWIEHGIVRIVFDATHPDVVVPKHLRKGVRVRLDFGFDLPKPIPDMKIDADAVSGTLSFPGVGLFRCYIPWQAIFGMGSRALDSVELWLNDAPRSVQDELLERAAERANAKVRRNAFRILQGGQSPTDSKRKRA
jgi:hypothetical protein